MISEPTLIDTSHYKYLHLRAKNNTTNTTAEFFWITDSDPTWAGDKHYSFTVSASDNDYKDYWIDLSGETSWNGTVTQIRIDPSGGASSGSVDYDSIALAADIRRAGDFDRNGIIDTDDLVMLSSECSHLIFAT